MTVLRDRLIITQKRLNSQRLDEFPKAYVPQEAEDRWYPFWESRRFFHADSASSKKPFTVVIPPPNITGILTMGHVLNNTIQDVFVRWKRMCGYETLWMPGTDHAGIATQNVVEKSLLKENKTRHDLGREEFLKRVWEWKEQYGGTIIRQLRKLGTSCDWERQRFTMDEGLSEAVQEIFVRLYNDGLIYRGKYIINWCPKDHTALSDDEVEYADQQTHLWHIRYPIKDLPRRTDIEPASLNGGPVGHEYAVVATTRPETMLGDTAVAVHPADERYKHLVGRMCILPLANREIPIITDEFVDPSFGSGMVKVTPAHDPNDYWVGQRHNAGIGQRHQMPFINILDESARLNDQVPEKYRGLDYLEARKVVVQDLEEAGLLEKVEPHTNAIGRCYRCNTVIQPLLSDQWFVKMKPLTERALNVVLDGTIRFHPERWVKTYEHWMTTIRDWCISRQLWWGHRIPVWYCEGDESCKLECRNPIVSKTVPRACPHCGSKNLRQDEDVLDTWFSSWLWPFSTLGWPKDNPDLRYFYPTSTLVTAPDIIFFWVARMIMAGMWVMKDIPKPDGSPRTEKEDVIPFRDVYFTSIIRDMKGRKMSKSLGNSPDPLDVIAEYGADALRFTIVYLAPLGQDVLYSNDKCELGRNFANKIWNAGRYLLMNRVQLASAGAKQPVNPDLHLDLADRWILSRLHSTIGELNARLEAFEIQQATKVLYEFIWHDFCDWYVEMTKGRLYGSEPDEVKALLVERALAIFEEALRLLHPFMPFVTEELWHRIAERDENASIMISPFPEIDRRRVDAATEREMAFVQEAILSVRNVRGELGIAPSKEIRISVDFDDEHKEDILINYLTYFQRLARVTSIEKVRIGGKPKTSAGAVVPGGEIFIPLEGLIDLNVERERIAKELSHARGMFESISRKLENESFVAKAPDEVVKKEREKLEHFKSTMEKLEHNLAKL